MRQIYKDIVIGFILASFVFTPGAFAKPQSTKIKRTSTKSSKQLFSKLDRALKTNKKGMKISKFVEAAKPMVKKREFRDLKKSFMPFWDKKFDKMVVGKDYFVVGFKGRKVFGRFVDRGPIAFIINGQPLLWKDVLIYGRAKNRLMNIMGIKKSGKRKVSFHQYLLNEFFPKAFSFTRDECTKDSTLTFVPSASNPDIGDCLCPSGKEFKRGASCAVTPAAASCSEANPGAVYLNNQCVCLGENNAQTPANGRCPDAEVVRSCESKPGTVLKGEDCICENGTAWTEEKQCSNEDPAPGPVVPGPPGESGGNDKIGKILFGALLLLVLFTILKNRKKRKSSDDDDEEEEDKVVTVPVPGWTPEPEGQCPTPGARGITEADLPPECRKSTCSDTNSCTDSDSGGVIY